jgi:hypothetical protein
MMPPTMLSGSTGSNSIAISANIPASGVWSQSGILMEPIPEEEEIHSPLRHVSIKNTSKDFSYLDYISDLNDSYDRTDSTKT